MTEIQRKDNKKKKKFLGHSVTMSICTFLIFVLLGAVFFMQIKSVEHKNELVKNTNDERIEHYREEIKIIQDKMKENKELNELLNSRYDTEMKYLFDNEKQFYELYKKYETEIDQYEFYAGLTTVNGKGIDIGIDDAQTIYESTPGFLVHDIYLNEIINVLRSAGAEAIAINGERIVSMSETLCLGPSIRVNNTKLFAPYHIEAIGEPQVLLEAFKDSAIYDTMLNDNLIVDPVIRDSITINKYRKSYTSMIDLLAIINEERPK